jgi:serine/threonine-protein kinase RsbW
MPTVEVSFTPLPAHVRTARLVATAVARRSGVDEALLDEVRLAVGEACSRAVEAHRKYCPAEPVRIALTDSAGRFEVEVTDTGAACGAVRAVDDRADAANAADAADAADAGRRDPGSGNPGGAGADAAAGGAAADVAGGTPAKGPGSRPRPDHGLGLAMIASLADEVQISETEGGVSIRMSWPAPGLQH